VTSARGELEPVETALSPETLRLLSQSTVVDRAAAMVHLRTGYDLDELRSVGRTEIFLAARRFDPSRGIPFDGFVWEGVYYGMLKAVRKQRKDIAILPPSVRKAAAEVLESATDPGNVLEDSDEDAHRHLGDFCDLLAAGMVSGYSQGIATSAGEDEVISGIDRERARALVQQALDGMPETDQSRLRMRFWENAEFDDIAARFEVSNATARRDHIKAIDRLAKRIRERKREGTPTSGGA
jgi:RNA polymerase sigma factor (sigma-70 family)